MTEPDILFLFLDYLCNNNCAHCFVGKEKREHVPTERLKEMIDEVADKKPIVQIGGGEPTLSPRLFEILDYLAEKDLEVVLMTNGRKLKRMDFVKKLKVTGVCIPIHSHLPHIQDKVARRKGCLDDMVEGIKNVKVAGLNLQFMVIPHSLNYWHLKDLVESLTMVAPDMITFESMLIEGNAKESNLHMRLTDLEPYMEEALDYLMNVDQRFRILSFPLCLFPRRFWPFFHRARGETVATNFGRSMLKYRPIRLSLGDKCEPCEVKHRCSGTWQTYYEEYGGEEWQPQALVSKT